MLRVVRVFGILALIFAAIMLWRISDDAPAVSPSHSSQAVGSKPIGTSTLSHGSSAPHLSPGQESAHPDRR